MIRYDVEQKSAEWYALRAGKLTASQASKLITPTGKLSTQYRSEIGRIIAEGKGWQDPEDEGVETYWMAQGMTVEPEARCWLEVERDIVLEQCGFISSDDKMIGFSPDAYYLEAPHLIPVEIKCPKPSTHIKWLLEGGVPTEHRPQVHFGLVVTGAPYSIFMSYNPNVEPLIEVVQRDEFTTALEGYIQTYKADLATAWEQITGAKYEAM